MNPQEHSWTFYKPKSCRGTVSPDLGTIPSCCWEDKWEKPSGSNQLTAFCPPSALLPSPSHQATAQAPVADTKKCTLFLTCGSSHQCVYHFHQVHQPDQEERQRQITGKRWLQTTHVSWVPHPRMCHEKTGWQSVWCYYKWVGLWNK